MARYRIELATVIELFTNVDSMADAEKFALDFITKNAVSGTPRYKLHAIYDTEHEVVLRKYSISGSEVAVIRNCGMIRAC